MFSFFSSYLTILITNYKALLWSGLLSGFVSSMVCLCFLDVFLQVMDAKALFLRLEERGLLDNQTFLSQLLHTIGRIDLLSLLETDGMQPVETDANPMLSEYRWKQKEMYYNWRDNSITVAQSVLFPMCFFYKVCLLFLLSTLLLFVPGWCCTMYIRTWLRKILIRWSFCWLASWAEDRLRHALWVHTYPPCHTCSYIKILTCRHQRQTEEALPVSRVRYPLLFRRPAQVLSLLTPMVEVNMNSDYERFFEVNIGLISHKLHIFWTFFWQTNQELLNFVFVLFFGSW